MRSIEKVILALAAMALLISTCSAVFVPTDDEVKWVNSVVADSKVIASDMNLISSAATNMDLIKIKTYSEYLKSDVVTALSGSEKYIVSNELQQIKDYYELSLKKYYSATSQIIEGIDTLDESSLQNGLTELQEGTRYLNLAAKEVTEFLASQ